MLRFKWQSDSRRFQWLYLGIERSLEIGAHQIDAELAHAAGQRALSQQRHEWRRDRCLKWTRTVTRTAGRC